MQVNEAFEELEDGSDDALKEVLERQKVQLRYAYHTCIAESSWRIRDCTQQNSLYACSDLIVLINGPLSKNDRKKLITLCTIDVHARDVVQRLLDDRVESAQCFQWHSQLRYYQNEKTKECQVNFV